MKYLLLICLTGCSFTTRYATSKCPVPTTAVLGDFFLGAVLVGIGQLKFNSKKDIEGTAYTVPGVVLVGSSYLSEFSCLK